MEVLARLAPVAQPAQTLCEVCSAGDDRAALAASAQVLARIEAEGRGPAHRSRLAPAALSPGVILGAVGLAGVFDDDQAVFACELQDRIHVGHLSVEMHRDHGRHGPTGALARHPARGSLTPALAFQVCAQLLGIHGVGGRVDIDELRPRADLGDGLRRRDEGVGDGDDRLAGPDARSVQREPQRIGAACHADAVPHVAERGEIPLEVVDHRAADESGARQSAAEHSHQFVLELAMRGRQIDQGHLPGAAQSRISFPRSLNERSAASSILTTRAPATPSLIGV